MRELSGEGEGNCLDVNAGFTSRASGGQFEVFDVISFKIDRNLMVGPSGSSLNGSDRAGASAIHIGERPFAFLFSVRSNRQGSHGFVYDAV